MKNLFSGSILNAIFLSSMLAFFFPSEGFSQQDSSWCKMGLVIDPSIDLCLDVLHQMEEQGPFVLRVRSHIIRNSNGQYGYDESHIETAMENLYKDFKDHNIFFDWDCDINYIDDDDYFNSVKGPHLLFHEFGSEYYIDMFFLNPSHPSLLSQANEIPGNAFYITGTAYIDPNINLINTSVVSHEMGHCLGLLHPHHVSSNHPPEYVDGTECEIRGDCVCDTAADPGLAHAVSYPTCEWIEPNPRPQDANGSFYSPDTENIMAYSHPLCLNYFTEGQGQRMRNIIAWSDVLQKCLVTNVDITTNEVWDLNSHPSGEVVILGDLVVDGGATLTVESDIEVRFGENSRMIVKPQARVNLHGTLTYTNCSAPYWQGVEVWGNNNYSQYPDGSVFPQGRFYGYEGAIVEHALTGFKLFGSDPNNSGGQVFLTGVTLRNNEGGVFFKDYDNFYPFSFPPGSQGQSRNYHSRISKCTFINDEYYPHEEFKYFINLHQVKGVPITGCSFVNNFYPSSPSHIYDFGYGIKSSSSTFFLNPGCDDPIQYPDVPCENVVNSYFNGLGIGISADHGGITLDYLPYTVNGATFENCFIGVFSRSIGGFTLLNNSFVLGEVPDPMFHDRQLGVEMLFSAEGFEFQENSFLKGAAQQGLSLIGIRTYDLGRFSNLIRRNYFSGLDVHSKIFGDNGGEIGGLNRGLNFNCNFNAQSTLYDFFVCPGGSLKLHQGLFHDESNEVSGPTGNTFSRTGSPSERDFSNNGEEINYHYFAGAVDEEPMDYSSATINLIDEPDENECQPKYCLPPCLSQPELADLKSQFFSDELLLDQTLTAFESASAAQQDSLMDKYRIKGSAVRWRMDRAAFRVLQHEILDTINYSQDSVWAWMYRMGTYPMILSLANQKMESGLEEESNQLMQEILAMASEDNMIYLDLMYHDTLDYMLSKDWDSLSTPELDFLKQIAQMGTPVSSARAAAPLWHRGIVWQTPCDFTGHSALISSVQESSEGVLTLSTYPNPATDRVTFELTGSGGDKPVSIGIHDAMGRSLHRHSWEPGSDRYEWDATAFSPGIYFYRLQFDNGEMISGKVILLR